MAESGGWLYTTALLVIWSTENNLHHAFVFCNLPAVMGCPRRVEDLISDIHIPVTIVGTTKRNCISLNKM
jgi:hypothetical protein